MKRIALAVAVLLSSFACAGAQNAAVQSVEIVSYGIYTLDIVKSERDANGVLHNEYSNLRHAMTTRTVPAQHGVTFGFGYKVVGAPSSAKVPLRFVTVFPAGGLHPTGKNPIPQDVTDLTVTIGQSDVFWWMFQDPWELVPGTWTFQVWSGDRKLAEQSFAVVAR